MKINLGCQNGWFGKNPPEYLDHLEKCAEFWVDSSGQQRKHYPMERTGLGRCYDRYSCQKCGIEYTVDSSD